MALKAVEMVEEEEERKGGWRKEKEMWGVSGNTSEEDMGRWSFWDPEFVKRVSHVEGVKGSMAMGTVLAIELDDGEGGMSTYSTLVVKLTSIGYSSHAALSFLTGLRKEVIKSEEGDFASFQVHSRPLGSVVYLITSLFTKPEVMRGMESVIQRELRAIAAGR